MKFYDCIRILTYLGFAKDYDTRSRINGREVQYYKNIDGRRIVTVQIYETGKRVDGRASSSFVAERFAKYSRSGSSSTHPTYFHDTTEMIRAIIHESDRMDCKYAEPGNLPTEKVDESK